MERKECRAANHAFELQWAVDNKRQLLSQAEERLQAHVVVASRKSLKNTCQTSAPFCEKPHDRDSTCEASAEEEEERESEAGDEKEGEVEMENVVESSDQVFADLPREDYVEAGRSLPPEGKAGLLAPRVVGRGGGERGAQVVPDKADRVKGQVKKSDIKVQASSSSSSKSLDVGDISHLGDSGEWTTVLPVGNKRGKENERRLAKFIKIMVLLLRCLHRRKCPSF